MQYWIDAKGISHHVQATDQRMIDGLIYNGNRFPAWTTLNTLIQKQRHKISSWLAEQGVRGLVGIDYLETQAADGSLDIQFVEVNSRFNGSTYRSAIWFGINDQRTLQNLPPLRNWKSFRAVHTQLENLEALRTRTEDILYRHNKNSGIIPFWTGALLWHL